jgi:hypothetical protein
MEWSLVSKFAFTFNLYRYNPGSSRSSGTRASSGGALQVESS